MQSCCQQLLLLNQTHSSARGTQHAYKMQCPIVLLSCLVHGLKEMEILLPAAPG